MTPNLDGAHCTGLWWLFDSTDRKDHQDAKALCDDCPVRLACKGVLDELTTGPLAGQPQGTWAGVLYGSTGVQRGRKIAACGTESGYVRHRNLRERTCEPCRAAHRATYHARQARLRGEVA